MAAINVSEIANNMLKAALPELTAGGNSAKNYAEIEFKKIAMQVKFIGEMYAEGKLAEGEAKALFQMQVNSTKILMLTLEGLSLIIVEKAINAALGVVRDTINTVLKFPLIP
jgi:hypothetical protein